MRNATIKAAARDSKLMQNIPRILCVDDEEFNLEILEKHIKDAGLDPVLAMNAEEAWSILDKERDAIDVVLLDRMMPGMDGLTLLKKMKEVEHLKHIPVIMQTAKVAAEDATDGIMAGAYYYVTKPYTASMVISIVNAALTERKHQRKMLNRMESLDITLSSLRSAEFQIQSPKEASQIAAYLAKLGKNPSRALVALSALLSNAIEHGNLGFGYSQKHELAANGEFEAALEEALAEPENMHKYVEVYFNRLPNHKLEVRIKDQGQGFNWQEYMDFDPSRITDPNGRGIAMANITSPGAIHYTGNGSEVMFTYDA